MVPPDTRLPAQGRTSRLKFDLIQEASFDQNPPLMMNEGFLIYLKYN